MASYKVVRSTKGMGTYDLAIHAIIRPPKMTYHIDRLGPESFTNSVGTKIRRIDEDMLYGDEVLKVSLFIPTYDSNPNYMPPNLILYCHCNASNKLECKTYVDYLPYNYAMAGFDFLGCGNSPNMYISLGYRESDQVRTIVNVLRPRFQRIIPWGRSMGAVSVLLYAEAPIMVVDSPFASVKQIGHDHIDKAKAPKCLLSCIFPCAWQCVKSSVKKRAQYDLNELDTVKAVKRMSTQQAIIFIAAKNDDLVQPTHSKKLYDTFSGRKAFLLVQGTHNSKRKKQTFEEVIGILDRLISENSYYQQILQAVYQPIAPMDTAPVTATSLRP